MRSATYQASSENKPTHHEHTKTSNNCLSIEFLSNQPSPTSPQDSLKCLKHLLGSMVAPHPLNRSERPFALRTPRTLRRTRGGGLAALGARARSCRPCAKPARAASSCMATPGRPEVRIMDLSAQNSEPTGPEVGSPHALHTVSALRPFVPFQRHAVLAVLSEAVHDAVSAFPPFRSW